MPNNADLKKLAIKHLHRKDVQEIKKQVCNQFASAKERKACMTAFDKNFIKSFVSVRKKQ